MLKIETQMGKIYYTEEFIKNMVALSALECDGVVSVASKSSKDNKPNINSGVKVSIENSKLNVEVFIVIQYGIKVSVIANDVIQKIKYDIENNAGIFVNSITVNINGIEIDR